MSNVGDEGGARRIDDATAPRPQAHANATSPHVVESTALLDGRSQLAILHNETVYFLRQTRFGKLILTK
jgi:hemin uptake protein HemP